MIDWWGHYVTQSDGVPSWEKWAALVLVVPWIFRFLGGGKR